jgi:hypothetical protein
MAELRFDVTGNTTGAQRGLKDLAGASDLAARGARLLADSLDKQRRAAAASAGATIAAAKADKILADASDEAIASFVAEKEALDRDRKAKEENAAATAALAKSSKGAASGASALVSPMGALAGAAVAFAPVIATVGTGLVGLGIAAAGIVSPILKAAKSTGGLQANLGKLDPAQRTAAKSLLQLQGSYDAFQKSLQPTILQDFDAAIGAAKPGLRGIQPVAEATGKALAGLFATVGDVFRSDQWQQFFAWMATQAGPDIRLLTDAFAGFARGLPGIVEALKPVSDSLLGILSEAGQLTSVLGTTSQKLGEAGRSAQGGTNWFGKLTGALKQLGPALLTGGVSVAVQHLHDIGQSADTAGNSAQAAAPKVESLAAAVTALNTALAKSVGPNSTFNNDLIATRNAAKQAADAVSLSGGKIGLHTQKERDAFAANQGYIDQLVKLTQDAGSSATKQDQATSAIRRALPQLQNVKGGTREYWQEVRTLIAYLDRVRAEHAITKLISVNASGTWHIAPSKSLGLPGGTAGGPFAAGGMVPGAGNRDSYAAMLTPGEVVVPKRMVHAGAVDHLRGTLPGFASGGLVPSYRGSVAGLPPWTNRNLGASTSILTGEIASMMAHAFSHALSSAASSLFSGGGGAIGGSAAQNRAIAMRMFPWPMSQWPAFNYVEMREAGYNLTAQNPTSAAYGMAQFIQGPSEYYQWGGNPNTAGGQLTAMFNYIRSRYITPSAAAAHEMAFNWYDKGGFLPVGLSLALNTTGRPEMVGGGSRGGGGTVNIYVNVPPTVNPREAGQQVAELLKSYLKAGGRLYPSGATPR